MSDSIKQPPEIQAQVSQKPVAPRPRATKVQLPKPRTYEGKEYYGVDDVAKILGVTRQSVAKWQNTLYMGAPIFTADERAHDGRYLYEVERVMQLKSVYHPKWTRGGYEPSPTTYEQSPAEQFEDVYLKFIAADLADAQAHLDDLPESQRRGLTLETLRHFHCGYLNSWVLTKSRAEFACGLYVKDDGTPKRLPPPSERIIIPTPSMNHFNAVATPRARCNLKKDFWKQHAGEKELFCDPAALDADTIVVVEGEVDAMTIWQVTGGEVPVVAILGCSNQRKTLGARLTKDLHGKRFVIMLDADKAGKESAEDLRDTLIRERVPACIRYLYDYLNPELTKGSQAVKIDANEILTAHGESRLQAALNRAMATVKADLDRVAAQIQADIDAEGTAAAPELKIINSRQRDNSGTTTPRYRNSNHDDNDDDRNIIRDALQYIPLADAGKVTRDEWFAVGCVMKRYSFEFEEFDAWSKSDPARYDADDCRRQWDSMWTAEQAGEGGYTIGTLIKIAEGFGFNPPPREKFLAKTQSSTADDADNFIHTRDRIKNCPENLIVPRDFLFDDDGITYLEPRRTQGKPPRKIIVTRTPIIPTKKFREPVKGNVAYEVAILSDGAWCTTEFEGATLADMRELAKVLATKGALILDAKLVCRFFADIIKTNSRDLPKIKSRNQTGWTTDDCEEFAFPADNSGYVVRRAGYDFDKVFKPKGDADTWKQKFVEVMEHGGTAARVVMGTAAASFLVRPLGLINLQVNIWGPHSIGKTPLLKFGVSPFGDPNLNALSYSFGATSPKSRLELHCAYRDLPLVGEEIESLSDKERDNLPRDIYNFSLGIGGQVLRNDGTLRDAKIFSGARLTSGENDICNSTGNGGELKRVLSLRCPTLLPEQFAADLHGFCNRHHGHFLQAWTQYIIKNKDCIAEKYHRGLKLAQERFPQVDPTQLQTLIAATTNYQFFKACLNLSDLEKDFDAINAEMTADIAAVVAALPTANDIDDTTRAIEFLKSFVAGSTKYFWRTITNPDTKRKTDICHYTNDGYGKIFDTGEVAFFPHALKKILEGEGGFKSADKLIAEFADKGYLCSRNDGSHKFTVWLDGKPQRLYRFYPNVIFSAETAAKETSA